MDLKLAELTQAGEVWEPLPDLEEVYLVSNRGRVYSRPRKAIGYNGNVGSKLLTLSKKETVFITHRTIRNNLHVPTIVYELFVGKIPEGKRPTRIDVSKAPSADNIKLVDKITAGELRNLHGPTKNARRKDIIRVMGDVLTVSDIAFITNLPIPIIKELLKG